MQNKDVSAILFDWHGVLDIIRFEWVVDHIFHNYNKAHIDRDEIRQIMMGIGFNDFTKGNMIATKFWNILSEVFHFDSLSSVRDIVLSVKRNESLWEHLGSLHKYRIGLLSDCPRDKREKILMDIRHADPFEFKLFSCSTHTTKEQDEFFLEASARFNLSPGKILFVDDSIKNIEKARSLGFNTFHFNWTNASEIKSKTKEFFNSLDIAV